MSGLVYPAAAQIVNSGFGGSIGVDWASYRHQSGTGNVDGSHFFQQYSLLYQSEGIINSGRAGNWNVSLGYEWNDLSSELADRDYDERTDKILYRGDILFAPGGLPLRIHAFSYDMHQSTPYSHYNQDFGALINPDILTDINNGQHITTGLTLLAGIKNGTYLGEYREALSQLPKLLIDFRETLVRDTERTNPVHNRLRNLAFVSLNKKDNWFHYRHQDYKDYEDPVNDYTQKTYLLGTVDHLYRRQWINLTNWIKVSTDLSLTQYEEASRSWEREDTYALNLFSKARRGTLNVSNYARFQRVTESDGVESRIYLPIFASGELDRQSKWRLMLIGDREESEYIKVGATDRTEKTLFGRFQLETTRYPGYVFTPELELEGNRTSEEEGNAFRLGFELRSNERYVQPLNWLVEYKLTGIDGEDPDDETVNFWGHELVASFERRAHNQLTIGGTQRLLTGSGENHRRATDYIVQQNLGLASQVDDASDEVGDTNYFGSYTNAYLEMLGNRRLMNRFEVSFVYEEEDSITDHLLELRHTLTSNLPKSILKMDNVFYSGEDINSDLTMDGVPDPSRSLKNVDMIFSHSTELGYRPNRAWEMMGKINVDWMSGDSDDAWLFSAEQECRYSLYQPGGLSRKVLEAYQSLQYERSWGPESSWYAKFELGADWSPFRRVTIGGNVTLEYFDWYDQTEVGYEIYAAVDYRKFRAKTVYEYRQLEDSSSQPTVKDSRLSVGVQRIF